MAPGQQNFPKPDKEENFKNALPGGQVISGAQQEDQLNLFKENAGKKDTEEIEDTAGNRS